METTEFKVPFAHNINKIRVDPDKAEKGQKYYCPDCKGELIFKSGSIKRAHFAHKYDPQCCDFHPHPETENHLMAKWKVRDLVNQHKNLHINRTCSECKQSFPQTIPTHGLHASLEYFLTPGFRADVAILDNNDNIKAVIEIKETHSVGEEKKQLLNKIPVGEFLATDILNNNIWNPIYHNFKPVKCKECKNKLNNAIQNIADMINKGKRIDVIREKCMRCGQEYKQIIPLKNKKAVTHYELSNNVTVDIAIVDENKQLKAAILLKEVTEEQKNLLKDISWISLFIDAFLRDKELVPDCDNFKPSKCNHCKYVHKEYNFTGQYKNSVVCPVSKKSLNVLDDCLLCKNFVDLNEHSVICIGEKEVNG